MKRITQYGSALFRTCPALGLCAVILVLSRLALPAAAADLDEPIRKTQPGTMHEKEGNVTFQPLAQSEVPAALPQPLAYGDALRTLDLARACVRFSDQSYVRMKPSTRLMIEAHAGATNVPGVRVFAGQIYISSRGGQVSIPVQTPHARGVPRGTEFLVKVDANSTEFTMFDGEVELSNG